MKLKQSFYLVALVSVVGFLAGCNNQPKATTVEFSQSERYAVDKKVITLPDRDEMLQRLLKVNDDRHVQERFYPILLESAGQERTARGVVLMLTLAIHDYVEGMPVMSDHMHMLVPRFIEALVDDKEVAEQAESFLQETLEAK